MFCVPFDVAVHYFLPGFLTSMAFPYEPCLSKLSDKTERSHQPMRQPNQTRQTTECNPKQHRLESALGIHFI